MSVDMIEAYINANSNTDIYSILRNLHGDVWDNKKCIHKISEAYLLTNEKSFMRERFEGPSYLYLLGHINVWAVEGQVHS